ncbi:MAG: hypothetical protein BWY69_00213 [Planctomycetes bacterium ADurb.Bin401]|nr:MAG: hypothetical protein BWY69_00213 [Planctomycetes bacterium ADurb.Bin401]
MTNQEYHSYDREYKDYNSNYSHLYSAKQPSCHLSDGRIRPQYTSINDLVEPIWFEKITQLMEKDKQAVNAETTKKYKYKYI